MSACADKYNNLNKGKSKNKISKVASEDQDAKFVALLTNMLPLLSNAHAKNGYNKRNNHNNGNDRYENGDNRNKNSPAFSNIEPCRLVHAGCSIINHRRTLC